MKRPILPLLLTSFFSLLRLSCFFQCWAGPPDFTFFFIFFSGTSDGLLRSRNDDGETREDRDRDWATNRPLQRPYRHRRSTMYHRPLLQSSSVMMEHAHGVRGGSPPGAAWAAAPVGIRGPLEAHSRARRLVPQP
jgi:hypothetical protein